MNIIRLLLGRCPRLVWNAPLALCVSLPLLLAFLPIVHAEDELPPAEGPEAGRELAAHLVSMQPAENVKWRGTLKISAHHKTVSVPVLCETFPGTPNWSVMYLAASTPVSGSEKLTVIFSTNAPNQYVFSRAAKPDAPLDPPQTLTGAQADIPLANSDFWLSDLGFEFYHWPDQIRLRGQMRRGRSCYVLQSTNPHPEPGGYSRVITWVDKESNQPLQADAYGVDGKKMKEFELGSVGKVNGKYQVKDLKMLNLKTGSRTYLEFDLQSQ